MQHASSSARRALVIGGSLGGLFAANILHRAGWQVDLYERIGEALEGRGAGIVTHPELDAALVRAGISKLATVGVRVESRVTFAPDGSIVGTLPLPQVLTAWGRLYRLLKDVFPSERYRFGRSLERVEQNDGGVTAVFADGKRETADLLIAADGIRSTVRAQFAPEVRPVYAGYVAWRGMVEEADLSPATHREMFGKFAFSLPPREQMLGYPVAGGDNSVAPGHRRYNFVWYRPADETTELPDLLTDESGQRFEGSIPPNRIRADVIADMRRAAQALLGPQFAEAVAKTAQPFLQPIYDLESEQLAFGRVAILGDAAFVARPHCGMGVTKAGGDAVALIGALERGGDDIAGALKAYSAERVAFGKSIVAHARHLGAYMQAQIRTAEERENAERYRTPEAVMRETAVPFAA